jgi:osmotically-inducible protein OsmY
LKNIILNKQESIMFKYHQITKIFLSAILIFSLAACAATPKKESAGEYVDDSVITTKVKTAIFNDATLKTWQINVKTYKGVVQLSGFVDSFKVVNRAGDVARRVEGVKEVKNDLVLK